MGRAQSDQFAGLVRISRIGRRFVYGVSVPSGNERPLPALKAVTHGQGHQGPFGSCARRLDGVLWADDSAEFDAVGIGFPGVRLNMRIPAVQCLGNQIGSRSERRPKNLV